MIAGWQPARCSPASRTRGSRSLTSREHDIYTAPKLRDRLSELLETGPGVVIDLSGASFVDSSILGALLNARQRAVDGKKGFAVCLSPGSDPAVRRVFEMTGLLETLPVLPDLDRAVETATLGPPPAHDSVSRN